MLKIWEFISFDNKVLSHDRFYHIRHIPKMIINDLFYLFESEGYIRFIKKEF